MAAPLLFYSTDFLEHLTAGHPESPLRLSEILKQLDSDRLSQKLRFHEPRPAELDFIQRIHAEHYLAQVQAFCQTAGTGRRIDEDTVVSVGTFPAARKAAGAAIDMVEALTQDRCDSAFCLVRPPGHHAMPHHLMGFCFFNNLALAALYAIEQLGLKRVAILDWDAHHGNGTEAIFYRDPRVLTVSWHQSPNWPGTGKIEDWGEGPGLGYSLNIPLPARSGVSAFMQTYKQVVGPALERFQPDLVLVAAGYDAHHADILTDMGMTATGYAQLTELIMGHLTQIGVPKVGFSLEGGYHLQALANSVSATLKTLIKQEARPYKETFSVPSEVDLVALPNLIGQLLSRHPLFQAGDLGVGDIKP